MRLATFETGEGPRLGAVIDGDRSVVDLSSADRRRRGRSEAALDSMLALIVAGDAGRETADAVVADPPEEDVVPLSAVRLLAPLPEPRQIRDFLCFEAGTPRCGRWPVSSARPRARTSTPGTSSARGSSPPTSSVIRTS